ncbi:MAG: FAD binding domain-containing protein [Anaerolineae bacterium]|nr:FAD binding domain-containing protein [Anaerolineae bacterium]
MLRNVKTYHRPGTPEEAVALVQSSPNAIYAGGGAWIVAQGNAELETVVDLQNTGLDYVKVETDAICIGAMATLQTLMEHPEVSAIADGTLSQAAGYTQSRALREQGTLGGTLIVAGPADPLTTVLQVLDAEVRYADPVTHTAPFLSFVAYRDRLIRTRVLLTEVRIKRAPAHSAVAFEVVGRSPKDKPIVCAAAYIAVEEGMTAMARVAVGGADVRPVRLHKTEHLLKGQLITPERVAYALEPSLLELHPVENYLGNATYRKEMARVLVGRALLAAWEKSRRG